MPNRDQTNTLLHTQDILIALDCFGRPPGDFLRRPTVLPRRLPNDFLVPNLRPDLTTPDLLAPASAEGAQS